MGLESCVSYSISWKLGADTPSTMQYNGCKHTRNSYLVDLGLGASTPETESAIGANTPATTNL